MIESQTPEAPSSRSHFHIYFLLSSLLWLARTYSPQRNFLCIINTARTFIYLCFFSYLIVLKFNLTPKNYILNISFSAWHTIPFFSTCQTRKDTTKTQITTILLLSPRTHCFFFNLIMFSNQDVTSSNFSVKLFLQQTFKSACLHWSIFEIIIIHI